MSAVPAARPREIFETIHVFPTQVLVTRSLVMLWIFGPALARCVQMQIQVVVILHLPVSMLLPAATARRPEIREPICAMQVSQDQIQYAYVMLQIIGPVPAQHV